MMQQLRVTIVPSMSQLIKQPLSQSYSQPALAIAAIFGDDVPTIGAVGFGVAVVVGAA